MGVSKVNYDGRTLIDLSGDSVTPKDLSKGVTAHDAAGNPIVGEHETKLQEKTITPSTSAQIVSPDTGYDALSKVNVNAVASATQATPTITVSSSGLITAKSEQTEGYVTGGTESATKQLTTQAAQTITPGTSNKTISSGRYLTGTQTIKGDSNLVAENIKSGVSIFGVSGTCSSLSTCTVVLDNSEMYTATTMYYTNSSGAYVSGKARSGKRVRFTVLCGTIVLISGPATANTIGASISNGLLMAKIYEEAFIRIDASAGETCTIIVSAT